MSLILEALRKSEAERLRMQGPGLHASSTAVPRQREKAGPGPWIAAAVGAVLLAGAWWVTREPASTPVVTAPAPVVAEPVAPPVSPRAVPVLPLEPAPPVAAPAPAPAVVERAPEPATAAPPPIAIEPPPRALEPEPVETSPAPPPLPGLASLSADERAALPPLKLSMFVWSPEPARRFAIVDGNRVGEGALLAGGTVAEIRPDGLVLDVGGRRLLVPRP
jgi:general secretion pathway protein B